MLAHQLPALPPFEAFWGQLAVFFEWLSDRCEVAMPPRYALGRGEEVIRVAAGGLRAAGLDASRPLETVRFAAANHLCVDLDYRDEEGRRLTRRIEAYSLLRTADGNVVLHAERSDGGGHRSYRVDRILDARVADQTFSLVSASNSHPLARRRFCPHSAGFHPVARPGCRLVGVLPRQDPAASTSAPSAENGSRESDRTRASDRTRTRAAIPAPSARRSSSTCGTDEATVGRLASRPDNECCRATRYDRPGDSRTN